MTQNEFLEAVQERLDLDRRDEASKLTTVVLTTFSEILYRTERDTLGAPLPKELDNLLHADKPENTRREVDRLNAETFLNRIQARADRNREDARAVVRAVLTVLEEAIGSEMLSDLGDELPAGYGDLFPFVNRAES